LRQNYQYQGGSWQASPPAAAAASQAHINRRTTHNIWPTRKPMLRINIAKIARIGEFSVSYLNAECV
jgi:hypothetical protein